jgi:hypothetical protein
MSRVFALSVGIRAMTSAARTVEPGSTEMTASTASI